MLDEDDWKHWPVLTEKSSEMNIINIGDDITATNAERLKRAIETKSISGILIKLNQAGTLTETLDTCMIARENDLLLVPSHRGGRETNDTSMFDFAVSLNADFIKVGPTRGERVSKYNRLMEIEDELKRKFSVTVANFRRLIK